MKRAKLAHNGLTPHNPAGSVATSATTQLQQTAGYLNKASKPTKTKRGGGTKNSKGSDPYPMDVGIVAHYQKAYAEQYDKPIYLCLPGLAYGPIPESTLLVQVCSVVWELLEPMGDLLRDIVCLSDRAAFAEMLILAGHWHKSFVEKSPAWADLQDRELPQVYCSLGGYGVSGIIDLTSTELLERICLPLYRQRYRLGRMLQNWREMEYELAEVLVIAETIMDRGGYVTDVDRSAPFPTMTFVRKWACDLKAQLLTRWACKLARKRQSGSPQKVQRKGKGSAQ